MSWTPCIHATEIIKDKKKSLSNSVNMKYMVALWPYCPGVSSPKLSSEKIESLGWVPPGAFEPGAAALASGTHSAHSHSSPELPGLPGQRYNTCSSSGISALIMWFLSSPDGSMIDHRGCKEGEQLFQASCTPQLYKICSYAIICSVVIPGLNCSRGNHQSQLFEGGYNHPPATSKCPEWKDIIQQHSLYVLYSRGFSYWLTNRKINYIAICYNCKIWLKPELF